MTAVAKKTLKDFLEEKRGELQVKLRAVCAKHLPPDRLLSLVVAVLGRTPELGECAPETVLSSIFIAGRLGLEPDGLLGQGYLVPFRNKKRGGARECQFIPGYRGLISLARRTGEVSSIVARVVREGDEFDFAQGTEEYVRHRPLIDSEDDDDPARITFVYAVAFFRDKSPPQFEVMTRAQVEKIRAASQAANGPAWRDHLGEMARKTVIRRLSKFLPVSTEFAGALALHDAHEAGESRTHEVSRILGLEGVLGEAPAIGMGVRETLARARERQRAARVEAAEAPPTEVPVSPSSRVPFVAPPAAAEARAAAAGVSPPAPEVPLAPPDALPDPDAAVEFAARLGGERFASVAEALFRSADDERDASIAKAVHDGAVARVGIGAVEALAHRLGIKWDRLGIEWDAPPSALELIEFVWSLPVPGAKP